MGSTRIDSNFEDLLSCFTGHGVRFLVVGGYAVSSHGVPRSTKDLDLWIDASTANAARTWRALAAFGMPLGSVRPADLATRGPWLQFGRAPKRVDILTTVDGLTFRSAWSRREVRALGGVTAPVLCVEDLIRNKRSSGRPQDLADADSLERLVAGRGDSSDGSGTVAERPAARARRRRRSGTKRKPTRGTKRR